jgi:hypothetical protein
MMVMVEGVAGWQPAPVVVGERPPFVVKGC